MGIHPSTILFTHTHTTYIHPHTHEPGRPYKNYFAGHLNPKHSIKECIQIHSPGCACWMFLSHSLSFALFLPLSDFSLSVCVYTYAYTYEHTYIYNSNSLLSSLSLPLSLPPVDPVSGKFVRMGSTNTILRVGSLDMLTFSSVVPESKTGANRGGTAIFRTVSMQVGAT